MTAGVLPQNRGISKQPSGSVKEELMPANIRIYPS
jgi:hypothetical protein